MALFLSRSVKAEPKMIQNDLNANWTVNKKL